IYYDSRDFEHNDAANTYASISYDDGVTWQDQKLSSASWPADGVLNDIFGYQYAGEYIGVDCKYCNVVHVWSDTRSSQGNILAYTSPFKLECPDNLNLCNA